MFFCPECDYQADGAGRCPQCNIPLVATEDELSGDEVIPEDFPETEEEKEDTESDSNKK